MTLEEIEKKRADRKAALEAQREEQLAKDMEALDALEMEYGDGCVLYVATPFYSPGLPTMAIVRAPKGAEYKRFRDQVQAAKAGPAHVAAQDTLATTCVVYPDKGKDSTYARMCERFGGLHVTCALAASKLAEGKASEEGKG